MTIAEWCLLGAVLIYLLTLVPAKAMGRGEFDNANPRNEAFYADPARSRARAAHQNGIETYPFFAAAILLAEFRLAQQGWIDALAVGFLILRVAYVAAYVGNRPSLRSALWAAGFVVNVALFLLPLWARA